MVRLRFFLLFFFALLPLFMASADPLPQRPVVIGFDPDLPPYEYIDFDGQAKGLNIDLGQAIGTAMGVDVIYLHAPWQKLRHMLATGQIDILAGPYHKIWDNEFEFAPPHAQLYESLWTRKDATVTSLDDLAGKQVAVVRHGAMQEYLSQHPELHITAVPVDSLEDALRLLAIGQHEAALGATLSGEYLLGRLQVTNVKIAGKPLLTLEYGFSVKKGNSKMLALVTEGLALAKLSGSYKQIYNKWIGLLPTDTGMAMKRVIKIGAWLLGSFAFILSLILLWTWTLKRQVRMRTADLKLEVAERERAMEQLKKHQQQLIQADKMASLGVLVSGVAHEINNPNALVLLNLPQLQRAWGDIAPLLENHYAQQGDFSVGRIPYSQMRDDIPDMLQEMYDSSSRIKHIVENLRNFSQRNDTPPMTATNLNLVAENAIQLLANPIKKATAHFRLELTPDLPLIKGNQQRLEQIVINLMINACQALENPSQELILRSGCSATEVWLEVEDYGCGIKPDFLSQLSDPFFTTRRESGGTGLGLSISSTIAQEHGGRLEFNSEAGLGTRARLILPRSEDL